MKKSLIYTSVITGVALCATGTVALVANANAEPVDRLEPIVTLAADLAKSETLLNTSKDETIYVIADATGTAKKTFIGNSLNTGSEALPFTMSVKYYLDGTEISASDLAHKSGHVKMIFNYTPTKYYNGKKVPFLALGGTMLDNEKFTNLKVENGKIIDDGSRIAVVGYALAGVNDDLDTDILPDNFTIEADVTDFELPVTYSLLTNETFAELDTSKPNDIDSLTKSMNDLATGLDQIISGTTDLSDGIETLLTKSADLVAGVNQINDGLTALVENNDALNASAKQTFGVFLSEASAAINTKLPMLPEPVELTIENYSETIDGLIGLVKSYGLDTTELTATKASLDQYNTFYVGLSQYTAGVAQAAAGTSQLVANLPALIDGETELYNGSVTLLDGLNTFKKDGIDKLVNFANKDLQDFMNNLRATVNAAKSYTYYKNPSAESVKFIVKTAAIK